MEYKSNIYYIRSVNKGRNQIGMSIYFYREYKKDFKVNENVF